MKNPFFQFKQFVIRHDRCAMKVGTDGVLLGAWTDIRQSRKVLDIGTGSGLIALMIAQRREEAGITGIDIDGASVEQARENVAASPWSGRIHIAQADIAVFADGGDKYDTIVSNPPYFRERVHCPDGKRNAARHTESLTFGGLLDAVDRLIAPDGSFSVVLPFEEAGPFITMAAERYLYLSRRTDVYTKPGVPPKRVLLAFGRAVRPYTTDILTIESASRDYSPEFVRLVKDFYLAL